MLCGCKYWEGLDGDAIFPFHRGDVSGISVPAVILNDLRRMATQLLPQKCQTGGGLLTLGDSVGH